MTLSARRAGPADLPVIEAITKVAYAEYLPEFGEKPVPMTSDYAALVARGETWLVQRDGEAVALAVLEPEPGYLDIFSLAVRPDRQGGGLGRFMLALAEDRARSLGLPELRLLTNDRMLRNIRVYGEAGFAEVSRAPNPLRPGWVSVHMVKRLA